MTVTAATAKISYAGNGSTTPFSTVFRFLANADLLVTLVVDSTGVETVQVLDTDYTVTGAGDASGTVTMTVAPANGETLVISRNITITQATDYVENDPFPAETHETALDKLTMVAQQIDETVDRSITLPISTASDVSAVFPAPESLKILRWNSAAKALELIALSDLGNSVITDPFQTGGVQFPTTGIVPTHSEGLISYDYESKTFIGYIDETDVTLNLGEEMWIRARNNSGGAISNGQVVYVTGALGNRPTIALAQADSRVTAETIGVATHDIADNEDGIITTFGMLRDVDTSAFSDGDMLYLSTTVAGGLTATKPTGDTDYRVEVGTVLNAHATQGLVLVSVVHPVDGTDIVTEDFTLTGNPTAPTQSPGNNSTRIANTAFVTAAIAASTTLYTFTSSSDLSLPTTQAGAIAIGGSQSITLPTKGAIRITDARIRTDATGSASTIQVALGLKISGTVYALGTDATGSGSIVPLTLPGVASGTAESQYTESETGSVLASIDLESMPTGAQTAELVAWERDGDASALIRGAVLGTSIQIEVIG
jgi:hypothetical protein